MKDPDLPPTHFHQDRILSQELLISSEEFANLKGSVREGNSVRFSSINRLDLSLSSQTQDFSHFNQFSLTALNLSRDPVLVGMTLTHGPESGGPGEDHISLSGGREELVPGVLRELKFPIECFGVYGRPAGWSDVRKIQLTFSYERTHTGSKELEIALYSLEGEFREIPPGPRLTREGLASLLTAEIDGTLQTLAFPSHRSDDSGLLIPPPHKYPRENADEILTGKIMGQNVENPIRWDANPLGELEWTHFLHRHHFLKEFLLKPCNTGNEYYAEALDRIIAAWIHDNPVPLESNGGAGPSWETLSVAWRLREWLWVRGIAWSFTSFSRETRILMLRSIWEHARSLMDHKGHPNNWIIVESTALALAGICFPEFHEAETWFVTGLRRLRDELDKQFFADGVHFEISPLYHAICLHALIELKNAAVARQVDLPARFNDVVEKCAEYLVALCRPDFTWPSINDSGSFDADYSALMRNVAGIFHRDDFEWIGTKGSTGKQPSRTFNVFPDAGIATIRSDWDRDANFVLFRAGPPGAAHIHSDALSIEIAALGRPRLVDPGVTKYAPNTLTDYYRSAAAHNVLLIDGCGPNRVGITWEKKIAPAGPDFAWWSDASLKAVKGVSRGPWEGIDEVFAHERTIFFVKGEYWLIKDLVTGSGKHEITGCWQFAPGRVETGITTFASRYIDAHGDYFELIPLLGQTPVEMEVSTGSLHPPRGWVSLGGTDQPATRCAYTVRTSLPICLAWLILPNLGKPKHEVKATSSHVRNGLEIEITLPEGFRDEIYFAMEIGPIEDRIKFESRRLNNSCE
ncbi:MAG: alginate lyase family protein [Desulfomonilaceae bacterium]